MQRCVTERGRAEGLSKEAQGRSAVVREYDIMSPVASPEESAPKTRVRLEIRKK